jgi:hypothetical protein
MLILRYLLLQLLQSVMILVLLEHKRQKQFLHHLIFHFLSRNYYIGHRHRHHRQKRF